MQKNEMIEEKQNKFVTETCNNQKSNALGEPSVNKEVRSSHVRRSNNQLDLYAIRNLPLPLTALFGYC